MSRASVAGPGRQPAPRSYSMSRRSSLIRLGRLRPAPLLASAPRRAPRRGSAARRRPAGGRAAPGGCGLPPRRGRPAATCALVRWCTSAVVNTVLPERASPVTPRRRDGWTNWPEASQSDCAAEPARAARSAINDTGDGTWFSQAKLGSTKWDARTRSASDDHRSSSAAAAFAPSLAFAAARSTAPATRPAFARRRPSSTDDIAAMTGSRFASGMPSGAKSLRSSAGFRPSPSTILAA